MTTVEPMAGDVALVRSLLVAKVPQAAPFLDAPVTTVRKWRATDIPNGRLPGRGVAGPVPKSVKASLPASRAGKEAFTAFLRR
jgi:hypothetical protein